MDNYVPTLLLRHHLPRGYFRSKDCITLKILSTLIGYGMEKWYRFILTSIAGYRSH